MNGYEKLLNNAKRIEIGELIGKTFVSIERFKLTEFINEGNEVILFKTDNELFFMYHSQSCCEHVHIEDITGDLNSLVGKPILIAEEECSSEDPQDIEKGKDDYHTSFTWTFYKFATVKGYVTIRWYGESNGYYSESVDIFKYVL